MIETVHDQVEHYKAFLKRKLACQSRTDGADDSLDSSSSCNYTCSSKSSTESFLEKADRYRQTNFKYQYEEKNSNPVFFWGPNYPPLQKVSVGTSLEKVNVLVECVFL